jgi:integrase
MRDVAAQFALYVAQCEAQEQGAASTRPLQRGSLKLVNGRWTWRWRDLPDDRGHRVRRSRVIGTLKEFPTEPAAREEAERLRAYVMPVLVAPGKSPTFEHVAELYTQRVLPFQKRSSKRQIGYCLTNHLLPALGEWRMHEIRPHVVQGFVLWQVHLRAKRTTIATRLGYLLRILSWALGHGFAAVVPRRGDIQLPRARDVVQTKRDLAYTDAEFAAIVDGSEFPYKALYALLGYTGLRVNEALALTWRHLDIDAQSPIVRVRATVSAGEIAAPKSPAGVRNVPLTTALVRNLHEYRAWLASSDREAPLAGLVFPGREPGRPRSDSGILRDHLTPLLERSGIKRPRLGFHAFRHRRAVELTDAGAPLALLLELMGWSNPSSAWPYLTTSTRTAEEFTEHPRARVREIEIGPNAARRTRRARAAKHRDPAPNQSLANENDAE